MTMTWPEFHPLVLIPIGVFIAAIGGYVLRMLLFADKSRPMHMAPERRAKVGRLDGQPWFVRAVAFVGIPGAIALFLTWALVGQVERAQTDHSTLLKDHVTAAALASAADVVYRGSQERQSQQLLSTMQRLLDLTEKVCRRLSKTDSERDGCSGAR